MKTKVQTSSMISLVISTLLGLCVGASIGSFGAYKFTHWIDRVGLKTQYEGTATLISSRKKNNEEGDTFYFSQLHVRLNKPKKSFIHTFHDKDIYKWSLWNKTAEKRKSQGIQLAKTRVFRSWKIISFASLSLKKSFQSKDGFIFFGLAIFGMVLIFAATRNFFKQRLKMRFESQLRTEQAPKS